MKGEFIDVVTEKGVLKRVEVLRYFRIKSLNKEYIIYRERGNVIYSAELKYIDDAIVLSSVEDERALDVIKEYVKELSDNGK